MEKLKLANNKRNQIRIFAWIPEIIWESAMWQNHRNSSLACGVHLVDIRRRIWENLSLNKFIRNKGTRENLIEIYSERGNKVHLELELSFCYFSDSCHFSIAHRDVPCLQILNTFWYTDLA